MKNIKPLLELALQYLDHPDVKAIPFALNSEVAANKIKAALDELDEMENISLAENIIGTITL